MAKPRPFSYTGLFASRAPEPRSRRVAERAKYDFAVAYPDPDSLPLEGLVEALAGALREEGRGLALYPHPQGYAPLRELVADRLRRERGIAVSADDVYLGDGSGQPIHMLTQALVDPGDVVLTEDWVYSGTLRTFHTFRADIRGVRCDGDGMLPDALEAAIRRATGEGKKPKLIYTIPTFQNPQGWTMTLARRRAMLEVARRHLVPIMEDDCYVDLRYEGEPVPSMRSMDDSGLVMYVASFSKVIAPGVRLGYMVASPDVMDRMPALKGGGGVNELAALAVHRYSEKHLDAHVAEINAIQRLKRDAMLAALGENFGSAATWSRPAGGLYIWLRMPDGVDLEACREPARAADVGFQSGLIFSPEGNTGRNYMRLCFGYNTPEEIGEGIARLAEVFAGQGVLEA